MVKTTASFDDANKPEQEVKKRCEYELGKDLGGILTVTLPKDKTKRKTVRKIDIKRS